MGLDKRVGKRSSYTDYDNSPTEVEFRAKQANGGIGSFIPKNSQKLYNNAAIRRIIVKRNLSNQSHVVLLAVPLNISGKFTCEISVEAPSFQTAMISGEMEIVELPIEQASVTGIQPRYRIGDLVDGNCSIKYSKPAANLTWTINGVVVTLPSSPQVASDGLRWNQQSAV
uniref:CD80-like immunoglobulin C2-set domain-containing protein n=1 Tax=Glossina pallidipes TaxID=7398 RepID=A0A1A9ZH02_GLOPL